MHPVWNPLLFGENNGWCHFVVRPENRAMKKHRRYDASYRVNHALCRHYRLFRGTEKAGLIADVSVVVSTGRMDNQYIVCNPPGTGLKFMHYIPRLTVTLAMLVLASSLLAYSPGYRSPLTVEGATTITSRQAKKLFDAGEVFIDVRNPRMFKRMHIPGSYHLDLLNGYDLAALEKIARRNQPIVIYSSGDFCPRAYRAASRAVSWGFTHIKYFRGGIVEWRAAKYPFNYAGPKQRETW
jgi:rhodanese-related sulfurtransferase